MTATVLSSTIRIGGPNRANIAEDYKGMVIGKRYYIPEIVVRHKKTVKKILFLAAHPHVAVQPFFNEEVQKMTEHVLGPTLQNRWEIGWHVTRFLKELRWALLEYEPHIVHFIGLEKNNGLFVTDSSGFPQRIEPVALAGSFELCAGTVECVMLGTAYCESQAQAITEHIDYVIGIPPKINLHHASAFTAHFYHAIGAGKNIEEAFESALVTFQPKIPPMPGYPKPILKKKKKR